MILSRKVYDDLRDTCVKAQAEARALAVVNAQLQGHIDWLQIRSTQLEHERAQLLKKYMNLDIPVPSFVEPPANERFDPNQVVDFHDVGDAMAKQLGIDWAGDGTLKYEKQ